MSSNGVRHFQGGEFPETEGTNIDGIDIRADATFRIACVLTLIGMRFYLRRKNQNQVGDSLPFNSLLDAPESGRACIQERVHVRQCIKREL